MRVVGIVGMFDKKKKKRKEWYHLFLILINLDNRN